MKLLLSGLSILISLHASAEASKQRSACSPLSEQGYFNIQEVAEKSAATAQLMTSVVRIDHAGVAKAGPCTASPLSVGKGLLLTASHCLDVCRTDWWMEDAEKNPDGKYPDKLASGQRNSLSCTMSINGKRVRAEIIMMNPCEMSKLNSQIEKHALKPRKKAKPDEECLGQGDLAVLRIDPSLLGERRCMRLATKPPALNDELGRIGYPKATTRGKNDSNGNDVSAAFGRVVRQNYCSLGGDPKARETFEPENIAYRDSFRGKLIQTTVDSFGGNSGGPVINSNGEIVAVTSGRLIDHGKSQACLGSSVSISVENLKSSLKAWGREDVIQEIDCRR